MWRLQLLAMTCVGPAFALRLPPLGRSACRALWFRSSSRAAVLEAPPASENNKELTSTRLPQLASIGLVAMRQDPASVAVAALVATIPTVKTRKWGLCGATLAVISLLTLCPSRTWRYALALACACYLALFDRPLASEAPSDEEKPATGIDAVATQRWDIPPPPSATIAATTMGVKRRPDVSEVSSELQARWKTSTLDPTAPRVPQKPQPEVIVPKAAPPPPPPPPVVDVKAPVVIATNHLFADNKVKYIGTWQLEGRDLVLGEDGSASTSPTFSTDTTWRLDKGQLRVELNCPRLTPTGNYGGTVPAVILGKITDGSTFAGELRSTVLGADVTRNITMERTVTPTTSAT